MSVQNESKLVQKKKMLTTCMREFICGRFCLCMTNENDQICDHDHRSPGANYQTSPDAALCLTVLATDHHHRGT